ncbi:hypothetical protein KQ51_00489 [Candidatus Izimaplasma bacterium HR1]|jgi:hypothetical protein|uniref:hypothetical protein n=1 Tax=Candidatus Izimoplasma sp. HR1 TaxID=1541959 RepID=UPI0004F872EB|nr:hypothetical protein KQ51_00489 [Candidatus Izimaplasma bacterium HR1]
MGISRLKEDNYKKYRRKRNTYLFLLIVPTTVIISGLLIFYGFSIVDIQTLATIFFPLLLIDFIKIMIISPKISLYSMYAEYALLTLEEQEPRKTTKKLFTTSWIKQIKNDGFIVAQDYPTHMLLYKYHNKIEGLANSDKTLVFVNIAKNESFDFYNEEIDKAMQAVYITNKEFQKTNKQITLQFKKYNQLDDEVKADIESAVLYRSGKQRLINLTIGYLDDIQSIYCICPTKRFPNKYVYFACQEIKRLSNVKE